MSATPESAGPARVVVVGSFNVDHAWRCQALPPPGATHAGRHASGPGGKGFNQAVASARAGARTGFVCALGDDAGGRLARGLATAEGINLHAQDADAPTGTAGIFVDAAGRNSIVVAAGANACLSPDFVRGREAVLARAAVVLAQLESPAAAIEAAFALAAQAGALRLLNPAPADADVPPALLALADVLTPNETEFSALLARHLDVALAGDSVARCDDATLHGLCRRLLPGGSVVVTLGDAGAFVSHADVAQRGDDAPFRRVAAELVAAVDTTGAGDAFNGALAAALAREPDAAFHRHLLFASRYAALSTEHAGAALSMPHAGDVVARFPG